MKKLMFILLCLPFIGFSQVYTHPTTGLQNTNLGACMVTTCSGTYRDDGGGGGGDYSNNINGTYRTFCPSTPNTCIQVNFTSFSIENGFGCPWELFQILDGATQNSTVLWGGCGTGNLGTWTSTDASGCLGFRFWSDNTVNLPGWSANITCVPCATGPTGNDDNDCSTNTPVCSGIPINATSTGPGLTSTCPGCLVSETYSSWYHVIINTGGTFELTISPNNGTDDYDFAVFQSNNCAALGAPIRCSYAGISGSTGFVNGQAGTTEGVGGDSWLAPITGASPGDEFFILVNDWSGTAGGYNLTWGGTATLDCAVLPVELLDFVGRPYEDFIELNWNVATELSLDRYDIEKMIDGDWIKILETQPVGSNSFYAITDMNPSRGVNIYRLKSIDLNGEFDYSDAINVNYNKEIFDVIISPDKITINATNVAIESIELFNLLGQEINNLPLSIIADGEKYILDLDQLPNNSYIIRVNGLEGKLFVKY